MAMILIRFGNERISILTSVVLPEPDGPDKIQIDPFLDRLLVKSSNA